MHDDVSAEASALSSPALANGVRRRSPSAARAGLLAASFCLVLVAVACGRASETDIDSALGITPTATQSSEEIAAATGTAELQATERAERAAQAATAEAAGGESETDIVALLEGGEVSRGQVVFLQNCQTCHGGGPAAANFLVPGTDADLSAENFYAVVREGDGHPQPPGAIAEQRISEGNLRHLYAFILDRVSP